MRYLKKIKNRYKILDWPELLVSLLVIYSALIYFFYSLNSLGITLALVLTFITFVSLFKLNLLKLEERPKNTIRRLDNKRLLAIITYLIFVLGAFLELFKARTDLALISPFEVINKGSFFLFYALGLIILFLLINRRYFKQKTNIGLLSLHLFLSLSLALIVYRIAYGFDPFIHLAAVETIIDQGVIYPKTPYYLGQYGLITILSKISGLSASIFSKLLVPLSAALILPKLAFNFFQNLSLDKDAKSRVVLVSSLSALTLVFSLFIISTPQNFAYLFLLLTIYSAIAKKPPAYTAIFALASAAIHPIAGIPAIIWSLWLIFKNQEARFSQKASKFISASLLAAGALLIPFALFIASGAKRHNLKFNYQSIWLTLKSLFAPGYSGSQDFLLNAVYLIANYQKLIIIAMILSGVLIFLKNKTKLHFHDKATYVWRGLLSINLSLIAAYILSSQINFNNIIAYEQNDFSSRIISIIIIFSSPFIALSIYYAIKKIYDLPRLKTRLIFFALIIFFISSSLYLAYPRFDKYHNSRGYSTSKYDLEAVRVIDKMASDKYLVLANQQVSAAALHVFGFTNYLDTPSGELYFYPIPTGGILYNYYLDMVYESPSRETMLSVMDLTKTQESYFVINKYWSDSSKIIKAAKLSADNWQALEDNNIFIFQYLK